MFKNQDCMELELVQFTSYLEIILFFYLRLTQKVCSQQSPELLDYTVNFIPTFSNCIILLVICEFNALMMILFFNCEYVPDNVPEVLIKPFVIIFHLNEKCYQYSLLRKYGAQNQNFENCNSWNDDYIQSEGKCFNNMLNSGVFDF